MMGVRPQFNGTEPTLRRILCATAGFREALLLPVRPQALAGRASADAEAQGVFECHAGASDVGTQPS